LAPDVTTEIIEKADILPKATDLKLHGIKVEDAVE